MPCCAVAGCTNNSDNAKKLKLSFHVFPKDKNLHKQWQHFCKRKDEFNTKTARICSEHFLENNYERDLKSELLGLPPRRKLKESSVPTQKNKNNFNINRHLGLYGKKNSYR